MTQAPGRPRITAIDLAADPDPYPAYAALRERGPVVRGELGQWLVGQHAAATALLRDPRLSSEFPQGFVQRALGDGPAASFPHRIVLTRDPPEHTELRRFMGTVLGAGAVRALEEHVGAMVPRLLAPGLERGSCELVGELAVPLPVDVVCRVIGIPPGDEPEVVPRVMELARIFDAMNLDPDGRAAVDSAVAWLRDYLDALIDDPAGPARPGSLVAALAGSAIGVRARREVLADSLLFLFHAGFETTMGLISNGVAALLERPDELARLRADPGLLPTAVEEFLRYDSPIQNTIRVARETFEFGGVRIRAGRSVMLLVGAANRDEAAFPAADRLDVGRSPNPHLGFGGGLHRCVGTAVARLMGRAVFGYLISSVGRIEPAGPAVMRPHGSLRSRERLPVSIAR